MSYSINASRSYGSWKPYDALWAYHMVFRTMIGISN